MELSLENLSKRFGDAAAVDDVSAKLESGVYGLLGANGAGKTTLMRMVCDVLRPSAGRIAYDGVDIAAWAIFRRISAITPISRRWISCCTWRR